MLAGETWLQSILDFTVRLEQPVDLSTELSCGSEVRGDACQIDGSGPHAQQIDPERLQGRHRLGKTLLCLVPGFPDALGGAMSLSC